LVVLLLLLVVVVAVSDTEARVQLMRDVDLPAQLLNLIDQMMLKSSVMQVRPCPTDSYYGHQSIGQVYFKIQ